MTVNGYCTQKQEAGFYVRLLYLNSTSVSRLSLLQLLVLQLSADSGSGFLRLFSFCCLNAFLLQLFLLLMLL